MCFGHFAYVGVKLCAGHVIPSAGLQENKSQLSAKNINIHYWLHGYKEEFSPGVTFQHSPHWSHHGCWVLLEPNRWKLRCVHWTTWTYQASPGRSDQSTRHWWLQIETITHRKIGLWSPALHFVFLSICIHTQVEVAFHPALLLHGMDGNKLSAQIPAGPPSGVPSLFVSKRFVAEVSKLIPVKPGASQLWWQDNEKRDSAERMKEAGNSQTDYE